MEFARTIHAAGTDLLNLISDILDLSKIESGTVSVEAEEVFFASLLDMIGRPFRHEAENRRLNFEVRTDPRLARVLLPTRNGCNRCSKPAVKRLQIYRARQRRALSRTRRKGMEQRSPNPEPGKFCHSF